MSITLTPCIAMGSPQPAGPGDVLILTGTVTNAQGKGVKEAAVVLFVDGKKLEFEDEPVTENLGTYKAEIVLPPGTLPTAKVALAVQKPCYEDTDPLSVDTIVPARSDGKGSTTYLAHQNVILKRTIEPAFWIAASVLVLVYVLIAFELLHRTLSAFVGAAALLVVSYTAGTYRPGYRILTFEDAIHAMDMNVIFLLMAMMMIVGILKRTGLFEWMPFDPINWRAAVSSPCQ